MDRYIGKMLDNRYEILERIGAGGMAIVYKAKCHRLNRLVAIKILREDLSQDADFRRRFNAESQAVAQLSHPNIMSVYDVSRGGDTEYIVMELIDGITLKQYMEKRGQLNWRESLHFITQIMRGLRHAHSRGIVHRDIKPQNIMVLRDGSLKVTDFGIACLENAAQTLTQEALGSVHYISPEQARGDRIDARSDIYSAGIVLYEMLSGRLPFEGDSAVSVAIQHLSSIPLAPREIKPDIPEQLELICMRAMASDLEKRYPSAETMIADLEAFRKNPNVSLDFEMGDIRPDEVDEPTRPLRTATGTLKETVPPPHRPSSPPEREEPTPYPDYDDLRPRRSRTQTVLLVIAGILAVMLSVVLFQSILESFEETVPQQFVVKNVIGMTIDEASEVEGIRDIFRIEEAGSFHSEEYEKGVIMRQDPVMGDFRKGENAVIKVWVSEGEDIGEMINVENQTVAQARTNLKKLIRKYELTIEAPEAEMQYNDSITEGYIISSNPVEGEPLHKGDTIYLVVSKGPKLKEFPMPLFIGQHIDKVREQLKNSWKLTCTDADVELVESEKPAGEIIWQSISETTIVKEWDRVKFQVSSGLPTVSRDEKYALPQDGREMVYVEVFVGDEEQAQYSEYLLCSDLYAYVSLTASGTKQVKVYFDGMLDQTQSGQVKFS